MHREIKMQRHTSACAGFPRLHRHGATSILRYLENNREESNEDVERERISDTLLQPLCSKCLPNYFTSIARYPNPNRYLNRYTNEYMEKLKCILAT